MRRLVTVSTIFLMLLGAQFVSSSARAAECCTPSGLPGCDDPMVMLCVCTIDIFCCMAWDATCVAEVTSFGCGSCGGCQSNCAGKQCGSDGCGGTCGECFGNNLCQNGNCVPGCTPNCAGKQCGMDGCTGTCGSCQPNFTCVAGLCQANCQPQCGGNQCGPDGCNGSCGSCGFGEVCSSGICQPACEPQCAGKQCGSNSCGGMCGSCGIDIACNASGQCVPLCEQQCQGKECGDDGCGGTCGSCPINSECTEGLCSAPCQPDCLNRECGSNGCGGQCGSCAEGTVCTIQGLCVPEDEADAWELDPGPDATGIAGELDVEGGVLVSSCPVGYVLLSGKCVHETQGADSEGGGAADSGCSAGQRSTPIGSLVLLLMGVLLLWLRRPTRFGTDSR